VLWERLSRLDRRWIDWGPVLVLQPIYLGWASRHHPEAAIPVALLATVPLGLRRRYPLAVLAAVVAATLAIFASFDSNVPPALWIAVGTVAARLPRRTSLAATAATIAAFAVILPLNGPARELLGTTISILAVWVIGDAIRTRRAFVEAEREESARRVAENEQARIARELHDVIAHNVSVMVVQAAAGRDVFDAQPERAREALGAIEETGRAALAELRQLLAGVRAEFEPQPGLTGLGVLVEGVRAAGLPVEVRIDGELDDLPVGLDLSAYRIVQEALTNTLKHARASGAEVRITRTPDAVDLEVLDDGVGSTANGDGHGLIGIRERASLVGGEVEAGPRPGGGFRVHARLPL
jgi:signal transduction histidine kinase